WKSSPVSSMSSKARPDVARMVPSTTRSASSVRCCTALPPFVVLLSGHSVGATDPRLAIGEHDAVADVALRHCGRSTLGDGQFVRPPLAVEPHVQCRHELLIGGSRICSTESGDVSDERFEV